MEYENFKYVLVGIITLLGLFMAVAPKASTKKELREDAKQVARVKRNGLILTIVGVAAILFFIVMDNTVLK